jgi:hypothetical protein
VTWPEIPRKWTSGPLDGVFHNSNKKPGDSGASRTGFRAEGEHGFRAEAEHFLANPGMLFGLIPECFPQVAPLDINGG